MHQGPTTKIQIGVILLATMVATSPISYAQLNSADEIIETIQDIEIKDDSSKRKNESNPNKPTYDEEFGKARGTEEVIEEDAFEETVAEPEEAVSPKEQKAERKEIGNEERESYENELEKNARKNRFERRELSPEDQRRFEVDAIPQEVNPDQPEELERNAEPVVGTPKKKDQEPTIETEEEFEEEITSKPTEITPEEPVGPAIYYPEERAGPVISYKNEQNISNDERKNLSEKTKVEIEEDPYVEGTLTENIGNYLKPYKERRPSWTVQGSVGVNQYVPMNYASDITGDDFELAYEDSKIPSPEFSFEFKKNFSFASVALGLEAAYYSTSNDVADFTLMMPTVKATLYLDMLFDEPYVAPYGSVGYTYMMYEEAPVDGSEGFRGETDNLFVALGALFQLDWLDPVADLMAYNGAGIENTFVYIEARTYLDQGFMRKEDDADFSSNTHLAGGVRLEF